MKDEIQLDIGKTTRGDYYLDISTERVFISDRLGEIIDRAEKEIKKHFGVKEEKKGWGFRK